MFKRIVTVFIMCLIGMGMCWSESQAEGTFEIPAGVTVIEYQAFYGVTGVKEVVLPQGLLELGSQCFAYSGITKITLPDSLTHIADDAFEGCENLSVIAPEGSYAYEWAVAHGYLQEEEQEASPVGDFKYKIAKGKVTITEYIGSDKHVVIPKMIEGCPVTVIGAGAFYENTKLLSVDIPNTVTKIDIAAFDGCRGLTNITIPDSVTVIEFSAFKLCTSLTSITIPNSITRIASEVFCKCSSLTSITIPNSVTSIGDSAFSCCTSLTSITIPDSVTKIESRAFEYCTGLTSIAIPNSVTKIGEWAFYDCHCLTSVTLSNKLLYIEDGVFSKCSDLTSITIPYGVTRIEADAFTTCIDLASITIPSSVTSIDKWAFRECFNLSFHTPRDSYAHQYAKTHSIPCSFYIESIPSAYYQILRTLTIDGKVYYEAELLKPYNGVSIINPAFDQGSRNFYMDAEYHVVTDATILCKLYTLGQYNEDSINSTLSIWKTTSRTCSSTARKFLFDDQIPNILGSGAAAGIKALTGNWSAALIDLAKILGDPGNVNALGLISVTTFYSNHLQEAIDYTLEYSACASSDAYSYERVSTKLDYYSYCAIYYEVVQGLCMPVIDEIIQNYDDGWDMVYKHFVSLVLSFGDASVSSLGRCVGPTLKTIDMVLDGDPSATDAISFLLSWCTNDIATCLLGDVAGTITTLCQVNGIDRSEYDAFKAPYYITIEEMLKTDLYKNHQLLAQPLS